MTAPTPLTPPVVAIVSATLAVGMFIYLRAGGIWSTMPQVLIAVATGIALWITITAAVKRRR